jgi:hypothetical protein
MAIILDGHPHFTAWTDPVSGFRSHVLTSHVAPVQQTPYYVNPAIGPANRWLWFTCGFPPNPQRTLGVVSLDRDRPAIRHFPAAGFASASPMVLGEGDAALFCCGPVVWRIDVEGRLTRLAELPASYIAGRHLWRLATHLSLSRDGRRVLLDGEVGNQWFVATADLVTGAVEIITEFASNHNHAQFSPHDADLFLIARDQQRDPLTGRFIHHRERTILMRTDGSGHRCINAQWPCRPYHGACHEWWTAAGTVAYVEYDTGVWEFDPATDTTTQVWKRPLCHAHSDPTRRWWIADQSPYTWQETPCTILLLDRATGREHTVVTALPFPAPGRIPAYHIDPHPQFSADGRAITYTTTVLDGQVDVAVAAVEQV